MKVRPYQSADYATASAWWVAHGWSAVPECFLPVVGWVIEDEGIPRAMAWLKQENSTPIAMIEWLVTNPHNTARQSLSSITTCISSAKACAKAMGRTALFTYVKYPSLARVFERCGFELADTEMIHLVAKL